MELNNILEKNKIVLNPIQQQYISNNNMYTLFIDGSNYYFSKGKIKPTCLNFTYIVENKFLKTLPFSPINYELIESNEFSNIYLKNTEEQLFVWWGGLNNNDLCIDATGANNPVGTPGCTPPACFKPEWENSDICKYLLNNKTVWYSQLMFEDLPPIENYIRYLNNFSNYTTLIIQGADKLAGEACSGCNNLINILGTFKFSYIKTIIWYVDEPWSADDIANISNTFKKLKSLKTLQPNITFKTWINFMSPNFDGECADIYWKTCGTNENGTQGYNYQYIYENIFKESGGMTIDYVSIDYYFSLSGSSNVSPNQYITNYMNYNNKLLDLIKSHGGGALALIPKFDIRGYENSPIDYNVMNMYINEAKIISPWYIWWGPAANYWNFSNSKENKFNEMVVLNTMNEAFQVYDSLRLFIENSGKTYVNGTRLAERNQYSTEWTGPSIGNNAFNSPNYFYLPVNNPTSQANFYCCYQNTHCNGMIDYNKPEGGNGYCPLNHTLINEQPVRAVNGYLYQLVEKGEYIYVVENNKCYSVSHSCQGYLASDCSGIITPVSDDLCFPSPK